MPQMNHPDTDLRKKAKKGIDHADNVTVKMILAMLEVQQEQADEEAAYEKEIQRRFDEYEQGRITPLSWDELEKKVRDSHKKRMKSLK